MRKLYMLLSALLLVSVLPGNLYAQTVQIGTGTETPGNTLYAPIYRFSATSSTDYSRSNILYTASELAAAGITSGATITSIAFFKVGTGATTGAGSFRILMTNSSTTPPLATSTTWSSIEATHTEVYASTSQTIPATTGWIDFVFTTPFIYTGGSIEIAFDWNISAVSGSPATDNFDWQYTTGLADYIVGGVGTSSAPATLNATTSGYKHRPNIQITYTPGTACTAPPTAGAATTLSSTSVCAGSNVSLSLTGNSNGSGQTYVWQFANAFGGPYSDISASSSSFGYSATTTTSGWYRAAVTCSGSTSYSDPVEVIVNPPMAGGTYTIDPGMPTGSGNFQTFADVSNALSCGISGPVVFNVTPYSFFSERLLLPQIPGASSVNTIRFRGNESTIYHAALGSADRSAIVLDGSDHVTIDSFTIDVSAGTYGWGIALTNTADSNRILNCIINANSTSTTSGNTAGIMISGSLTGNTSGDNGNGNLIANNIIRGGYWGISLYGSTSSYNTNNRVINNKIEDFYYYSIYSYGNDNVVISKNDISRPLRSTTSSYNVYLSSSKNVLLEKNRIHDLFAGALSNTSTLYTIYLTGSGTSVSEPNKIENNLIYQINKASGTIYGIYGPTEDNWNVYHNTIVLDDASSTAGSTYGIYVYGAGTNIKNNIVYITRGGTGTKYALYYSSTGVASSDNNVLYLNAPAGTNNVGYYNAAYTTLADWQAANGGVYDQLSKNADPLFYNAGSWDYTPFEASLNNMGDSVGVTTDILDSTRTNLAAPDPGAYRINLGACANPPTAGLATASTPNACAGADFTLDLTGNSIGDNQTYQWQSSPDNTSWTNISTPQTITAFITNQAATLYYRAAVKCGNGAVEYSPSVQVITPSLVSGTYTINSSMPTGSGNFQSFNEAVDHIKCGINGPVVFNVEPGTFYNEQVTIPAINGTSVTNTITFNGNGATIDYISTSSSQRAIIELDGADHVTIDSLTLTSAGSTSTEYAYGVRIVNDADSNRVESCIITLNTSSTSSNYAGIVLQSATSSGATTNGNSECDGNVIANNMITGGYYGIVMVADGNNDYHIRSNSIINNKVSDFYSYGLYINGGDGTLIQGNEISRPSRSTVSTFYGIYLTEKNISSSILQNKIHSSFNGNNASTSASYGIYLTGVDASSGGGNTVANNMIFNFNNAGTQYGLYNSSSDSVRYYYNSILLSAGTTSSTTYLTRGFYQTGAASGIELKNNIIMITRQVPGQKQGLYFATSTTSFVSDHNDLYINSSSGTTNASGYYSGTNYVTLADWQGAPGNPDQNSISADPLFLSNVDLHISPGSPVENMGLSLADVVTDIDGQTRDVGVTDIGADEIVSPPCSGAVGGTATASTTQLCVEGTTSISATGFSTGLGSSYQWQISADSVTWTDISGETMPTGYNTDTINSTTYYRLKVSCTSGTATDYSNVITVTVNSNPTVSISPAGPFTICEPATQLLSMSATSASNPSFQWMLNGAAINGAVTNTHQASASGSYTLAVTDSSTGCSGTSTAVTVIVNPQPSPLNIVASSATVCPASDPVQLVVTGGVIEDAAIMVEDFNSNAAGWITTNNTTGGSDPAGTAWTLRPDNFNQGATFSSNDNSQFMLSNSDEGGSGNNTHTILQSPGFSTAGFTTASLRFYHYYNDYNADDSAIIEASTDGTTWSVLQSFTTDQGTATNFTVEDIDLGSYLNQPTVFIRFKYVAVWGFYWAIDNVTVSGDQSTNITWSPASGLFTDPAASMAYSGGAADTVYAEVNSTTVYTATATSSAGCTITGDITLTFDSTVTNATPVAGAAGDSAICASYDVSVSNNYFYNCSIIASVQPSGTSPVSGNISVCVTVDDSVKTAQTGEPYVQRHFNITPSVNPTTATSTLTLYFLQSEFDAFNAVNGGFPPLPSNGTDAAGIANIRITQYNGTGTAPGNYSGTATEINPDDANIIWNAAANRWEIQFEVTGSGGFYMHTGNFILPVTLLDFKGEAVGSSHRLSWTTSSEVNNTGFAVERSADGVHFSQIGWVSTSAADGNSSVMLDYRFTDNNILQGNNYYRLRQVNKNGTFANSAIALLRSSIATGIVIQQVFPVPATDRISITVSSGKKETVSLILADASGKIVYQQSIQLAHGSNLLQMPIARLARGSYVLKLICNNGCENLQRIVIKQ